MLQALVFSAYTVWGLVTASCGIPDAQTPTPDQTEVPYACVVEFGGERYMTVGKFYKLPDEPQSPADYRSLGNEL